MRKDTAINEDDFNRLLEWLSPDREEAGEKYEIMYKCSKKIKNRQNFQRMQEIS